ncbi:DUF4329 domain-containing protein [Pontivivens insulae]|uniref:DUF4329 domain-containing protein n=1 Tax=Pontivivens insulae TaxID=1639689 RepID=A0A2R8A789_9RHOB|nr:DUF4329 domain-containing protein [Pontivivens insulae]RED18155.1 uncharacterized protein DUF4329 [Pontivivens insulae]SPF28052.1 hypothetical protein POI8812_00350 [Pontivivens insulae]
MRIVVTIALLTVLASCTEPVVRENPTFGEPDKPIPSLADIPQGEPDKVLPGSAVIAAPAPAPSTPAISGTDVEAVATQALLAVQRQSITEAREYCGYIVQTASGQIQATRANPGTLARCFNPSPTGNVTVLASYHTHGRFDAGYDNEVPSPQDMMGDFQDRIDGYIATPGGRLWHVDFETRRAYQLCRSCMPSDPNARETGPPVLQSYTLPQLQAR